MRAVVVGGGVGGAASAVALRRAGAEVVVLEAHEDPAGRVGSFVSLAANGLSALGALGCVDRVRSRGFTVARQHLRSGKGRLLADVPRGRRGDSAEHSVTLLRADLVAELRGAAAEAGARIVTGERLVGMTGGTALFASGRTEEADVVVGADGLWSTARTALNPALAAPRYAGMYVVWGRTRAGAPQPAGDPTFTITFCRNGAFLHVTTPSGEVWWQAQVTSRTAPALGGQVDDEWRRRLGDLFRHEPVPADLIASTDTLELATLQHMLAPVPRWHDGTVVLVGDAIHPVGAGQGASMALEDAVALGSALAGSSTVLRALQDYELARRPRVTEMLKASDDNREAKSRSRLALRLQEIVMPLVVPLVFERATGWLYDYTPPVLPGAGPDPAVHGVAR
ncbi:FAD-dependent monooxygenase [Antribacter sp. KLBMP9083]|uniref:FAD-dependent monooxygenase n=1 Tax=Antribacter soli TaxID=2910976 RepID=A0AA41U550_9MICO|nr:NAD(P)/FAD-dependent oxidoreductase [Antribacter soli]MCF4119653.1 FAD-dependent monooxygenase [Antribacter soli]